jgi:hypothetical protein
MTKWTNDATKLVYQLTLHHWGDEFLAIICAWYKAEELNPREALANRLKKDYDKYCRSWEIPEDPHHNPEDPHHNHKDQFYKVEDLFYKLAFGDLLATVDWQQVAQRLTARGQTVGQAK